jgi:hypothetical protein
VGVLRSAAEVPSGDTREFHVITASESHDWSVHWLSTRRRRGIAIGRLVNGCSSRPCLRPRVCLAQHGPWVVVAANGHDLLVYDLNVLGKGNRTKDRVDVEDRDTVLSIDDKTKDVDVLHDSRERFKGSDEGFSALIGIHRKYTDHIRMKRKVRWVVAPDCVDVFLDNAYDFVSHDSSMYRQSGDLSGKQASSVSRAAREA